MAPMADESTAMPRATTKAAEASEVDVGVADATSESRAEKPMVLEEPTVLLEVSEGVVGHAIQPPSP